MPFHIESTSYCANGQAPRWSWWIRGVHGSSRYGIVGTDEDGDGLYLFIHRGNQAPERQPLLGPEQFSLAGKSCRTEALHQVSHALKTLGWNQTA
ncbi:hypothetical protein [Uliginosibacterium sp. 31-12]|uniref:hypothetical protein n=1 Tax=Uliginosibacterium sp. 31-12 TaxID=3062781 RepID=UPI0026E38238|nr:hypothetical protein [Uliginosibacterium sp. 31-12]MDO6385832.1 hypothetical protein [Uliginosibacterium sp. 31-12]